MPPFTTWTWLGAGGWSLSSCPPALPTHLPALGPGEDSDEDGEEVFEEDEDGDLQRRGDSS